MFFSPQKVEKTSSKSCILMAVGIFFLCSPTAQNSPELHFCFINSFIQSSLLSSLSTTVRQKAKINLNGLGLSSSSVPLLSGCLETKLFLHRASWKIQENAEVNKLNQQNARSKVQIAN